MATTVHTVLHAKATVKTNQQASTPHSTQNTVKGSLRIIQREKTSIFSFVNTLMRQGSSICQPEEKLRSVKLVCAGCVGISLLSSTSSNI